MAYRNSRNLEASLIDFFTAELIAGPNPWVGVQCEKSLKQAEIVLPTILIYVQDTDAQKKEIGSGTFLKFPTVVIRIYAKSDGQRLDLADWVLEQLEGTISYYTYTITSGVVSSKVLAGGISIVKIIRNDKELGNTDPALLASEDRYRHNLTFSCYVGEI